MAAKATVFDTDLLKLILNATAIANLADNASSSPFTNIYVALHTASPGVGGTQATNECAYGSYARQAVARTSGGWTVASGSASPVATIAFPACTSGSETATYFSLGTVVSGATKLLYFGTVTPNIVISTGVTPQLTTASTITES